MIWGFCSVMISDVCTRVDVMDMTCFSNNAALSRPPESVLPHRSYHRACTPNCSCTLLRLRRVRYPEPYPCPPIRADVITTRCLTAPRVNSKIILQKRQSSQILSSASSTKTLGLMKHIRRSAVRKVERLAESTGDIEMRSALPLL